MSPSTKRVHAKKVRTELIGGIYYLETQGGRASAKFSRKNKRLVSQLWKNRLRSSLFFSIILSVLLLFFFSWEKITVLKKPRLCRTLNTDALFCFAPRHFPTRIKGKSPPRKKKERGAAAQAHLSVLRPRWPREEA